jgi:hypothetical protein
VLVAGVHGRGGATVAARGRFAHEHTGRFLELLDREQQVAAAASLANQVIAKGEAESFIKVLGHAVLREDAGFRSYQTLEAGVLQFNALRERYPLAARRTIAAEVLTIAAEE